MKKTILIIAILLTFDAGRTNYLFGQTLVNSTDGANIGWKQVSQYPGICFAVNSKGYIFAGSSYSVARSKNDGENWVLINLPNTSYFVFSIAINSKDAIFATTQDGKLYRSLNDGDNWTQLFPNLTGIYFNCVANTSSDTLLIGTEQGIYRSADNAESLEKTDFEGSVEKIFVSPADEIFINSNRFYRSFNNVDTWSMVDTSLKNTGVNGMAFDSENHIYAGTAAPQGGVYKSIDNGYQWNITDYSFTENSDSVVTTMVCDSADNVIFGTFSMGLFFMKSDGSNLTQINNGVPAYDFPFALINISDNYILAGYLGMILKSTKTISSGIVSEKISPAFSLEQNFPNPFSSSTTIQYTLPEAMYAKVSVLDPDGRIIETLIDQYQLQGTYNVQWNASGKEPGIYFFEIETKECKRVKKMLLIK